jgi:polysaccharide transporter, PST family
VKLFLKNVAKGALQRFMIVALSQIAIVLSLPYITRQLGIEIFSFVSIGMFILQFSLVLIDWGFYLHAVTYLNKHKNQLKQSEFVSTLSVMRLIIISLICIILYLAVYLVPKLHTHKSIFYALLVPIIAGGLNPLWFFQIGNRPDILIMPTLFARLCYLALIFYFVKMPADAMWVFVAQGVTFSMVTIYGYLAMKRFGIKFVKPSLDLAKEMLKNSTHLFFSNLINNQANVIWGLGLSTFASHQEIVFFNLADQCYRAGIAMTGSLKDSIHMINVRTAILIEHTKPMLFLIILLFALSMMGWVASPKIIKYFFAVDFLPSLPVIYWMLGIWLLNSISNILGYPFLGLLHNNLLVSRLNILISILHILALACWLLFWHNKTAVEVSEIIFFISLIQCALFFKYIYSWIIKNRKGELW